MNDSLALTLGVTLNVNDSLALSLGISLNVIDSLALTLGMTLNVNDSLALTHGKTDSESELLCDNGCSVAVCRVFGRAGARSPLDESVLTHRGANSVALREFFLTVQGSGIVVFCLVMRSA